MDIIINGLADDCPSNGKALATLGNYWFNVLNILDSNPKNPALGDFLRRYHQLSGDWIVASPIHWEATHNDAMIVAIGEMLELSDAEARDLFQEVQQFLKQDNLTAYFHDTHLWLIQLNDKPYLASQSLPHILHHSLLPILKNLDESLYWQRLFTEMQMLFSSRSGLSLKDGFNANGLWFHGEGEFHFSAKRQILTDDKRLIEAFPGFIQALESTDKLNKNTVICLQNPQWLAALLDKAKNKGLAVQCYWNNIACQIPKQNRLIRLWRSLIHANKKKSDC
ncbi:hypothetical protein Lbir_0654 [Legionella birminghamensis]|uniref:Uncharacterized protein conserved in bacteria n=1 Tax=Legionella birminghamensis TaxID=28083 RepID=A0A378IAH1_9GAMM|nr:hypothetical protein [Legionella birminghamensis]KTC74864.1 hypothetical protein Lbir_0654 [Legionella birminghamensis]STX31765.1 Uncharacterized protein conserved in bacteria [Legionella birminghamensis]